LLYLRLFGHRPHAQGPAIAPTGTTRDGQPARGQRAPHQLRPGPHRLSRETVVAHQQRRILAALAEAIAEHGYGEVTVERIVRRAGVSRKTFYEINGGLEQWLLVLCGAIGEDLLALLASARAGLPESDRPRALGTTLAGFCAARPDDARICFVESLAGGRSARAWREDMIGRLCAELAGDPASLTARAALGATVEIALGGQARRQPAAVAALVAHVLAGDDAGGRPR